MFERKLHSTVMETPYRDWYLCYSSEEKLVKAIKEGGVILVDGIFLLKCRGKFSALAIKDTKTKDGTPIKAGYWYSPVDYWAREKIRKAFDHRRLRVRAPNSTWSLMREAKPKDLALQQARQAVKTFRFRIWGGRYLKTLPNGEKVERHKYRSNHAEAHDA